MGGVPRMAAMHCARRWGWVVCVGIIGAVAAVAARAQTASAVDPASAASVSASGQRIYDETRAKLLQVRTLLKEQDSQASVGSGFVMAAEGLAITNYHVVSQFALQPERYRLSYTMAEGRSAGEAGRGPAAD